MKVYVAQINPCLGDSSGIFSIIKSEITLAIAARCDVVLFPELATVGYPPRDLLYMPSIWENQAALINELETFIGLQSRQITVIVGGLHEIMLSSGRYARYNAAWILDKHYGRRVVHKTLLPRYDVFDETRYFTPHKGSPLPIRILVSDDDQGPYDVTETNEKIIYVLICEDIWNNEYCGLAETRNPHSYTSDPIEAIAAQKNGPLFVLNASPYWKGKINDTQDLLKRIADRIHNPVIWCNQVGAHDDIITGGYSMIAFPRSATFKVAAGFQTTSLICDINNPTNANVLTITRIDGKTVDAEDLENWRTLQALSLYLKDYFRRCGFTKAVLGLSGGIDSAVVAFIAKYALGSENVAGITMPSEFSSKGSVTDSQKLAKNLNILCLEKPIKRVYEEIRKLFLSGGKQKFTNPITDENIQPRVRANILMAYANEYNALLLTTGNKSEITVGYCTLYGDTCGGLAVISDLWKTEVYSLARFINKYFDNPIPVGIIEKPPSPELAKDQKDTDSLPPYEVLDPVLRMFVEKEMGFEEVWKDHQTMLQSLRTHDDARLGVSLRERVRALYNLYLNSEFKRQQLPVGPKLSSRAVGSGRRMPIARKITFV